jgi:hypothetical protein
VTEPRRYEVGGLVAHEFDFSANHPDQLTIARTRNGGLLQVHVVNDDGTETMVTMFVPATAASDPGLTSSEWDDARAALWEVLQSAVNWELSGDRESPFGKLLAYEVQHNLDRLGWRLVQKEEQ